MEHLGYNYSVRNKTGKILYYKCTEKKRFSCKGSAKKMEDGCFIIIRDHNHPTNVLDCRENSEVKKRLVEWYQFKESLNRVVTTPQDKSNNKNSDALKSIKVSIPLVSLTFDMPILNLIPNPKSNLTSNHELKLVSDSVNNETSNTASAQAPMTYSIVKDESQSLFSNNKILSDRVPKPTMFPLHNSVIQANNEYHGLNGDTFNQNVFNYQREPEQEQPMDLSIKTATSAEHNRSQLNL